MNPYAVLEIDKSASESDIKKAYYRLAKVWHPDRVSDPKEKEANTKRFLEISRAYETLIDPAKRKQYDQFGVMPGDQYNGTDSATDAQRFKGTFSSMFGGGGGDGSNFQFFTNIPGFNGFNGFNGFQGFQGFQDDIMGGMHSMFSRGPEIIRMPCTLEEIFTGATKTVTFDRRIYNQSGSFEKKPQSITVQLQKHWREGTRIRHPEMGDELPDGKKQEAIVMLTEQPNRVYQRAGDNLRGRSSVSLQEALCGFEFQVKDLGGVTWTSRSTGIISPTNRTMTVTGAGMHRRDGTRGDIQVEFAIRFPDSLSVEQKQALQNILRK